MEADMQLTVGALKELIADLPDDAAVVIYTNGGAGDPAEISEYSVDDSGDEAFVVIGLEPTQWDAAAAAHTAFIDAIRARNAEAKFGKPAPDWLKNAGRKRLNALLDKAGN
jgi:hypothetical protein